MFHKSIIYVWILLIVFLKIRVYNAQAVNNTSSNKEPTTSVNTKFSDFGGGYPNMLEPGLFGNSPNNYRRNPLLYGNQNNNMQGPQQGYGWNPQYPSQGYISEKPYQPPGSYPGNQGNGMYPLGPNTSGPDFNSGFNPNYQIPNVNRPGNGYPGYINRPYQNGRLPNQGGFPNRPSGLPDDIRYFPQGGQYPSQGNFQGNPNLPAGGVASNLRPNYPDNINNIPDTNVQFPGSDIRNPNQANQYPRENGLGNQGNVKIRPNQNNNNYPSYSSNNMPGNNMQHSLNSNENNDGSIRFPNEDSMNQMSGNNNPPGAITLRSNMNGTLQIQLPNNQQFRPVNGLNANDTGHFG